MLSSINDYQNLSQFISDAMQQFADKPAYSCLGQTLTFQEIDSKSTALAAYFQSLGLCAGDRIVIQLPNLIQYPIVNYAALKAGIIVVNTNPLYTPREMKHQFNDSGAKAIVILSDLYPKLLEILAETNIEQVIVTGAADLLTNNVEVSEPNTISFNQAIIAGEGLTLTPSNAALDDVALLQYTGGTTGVSKGAQLTHRNVIANALQSAERIGERCREGMETFVCPLPLYHIYAYTINMLLFSAKGNLNVLIPNPRDLDAFIAAIKPFKITGIAGLNSLFVGLCNKAEFRGLDFSQLSLTLSGGTALTHAAASVWREVTGCSISEGYGLSETSPVLTLNTPGKEEIGTVGLPVIGTEIQFWDENDKPVADGESGQLVARGPQVMKGYWNMPEETAKVMTADGFFKTGDIGLRQENGNLRIVDRLKDMIIVSGFNVYPNEIEDVLVSHPAVLEAAVIGEADEKTGELVHAYITLKSETQETEIVDFCRERLTNYKMPKKVTILDELPKSSVGKILRRQLRK
ncbi:AMP-binding protein [Thalassotalea sp. G2M2-11]|uniref:AMP-binding protein n=1 Tax=Thalassotalea sp. G2M2-11 TaxID=2787627 RepID=UPI0019CF941F|nr:AMP-binding protein [Thalassotalea sp. G2M2-11]